MDAIEVVDSDTDVPPCFASIRSTGFLDWSCASTAAKQPTATGSSGSRRIRHHISGPTINLALEGALVAIGCFSVVALLKLPPKAEASQSDEKFKSSVPFSATSLVSIGEMIRRRMQQTGWTDLLQSGSSGFDLVRGRSEMTGLLWAVVRMLSPPAAALFHERFGAMRKMILSKGGELITSLFDTERCQIDIVQRFELGAKRSIFQRVSTDRDELVPCETIHLRRHFTTGTGTAIGRRTSSRRHERSDLTHRNQKSRGKCE